jgi:sugar phosphate isomerase/epimerase
MASGLINLIDAAEEPASNWRACGIDPPVRSEAVLDARDELIALAEALTVPNAISVPGLALTARLIWDRQSPIFTSAADADVATWARHAREGIAARAPFRHGAERCG